MPIRSVSTVPEDQIVIRMFVKLLDYAELAVYVRLVLFQALTRARLHLERLHHHQSPRLYLGAVKKSALFRQILVVFKLSV